MGVLDRVGRDCWCAERAAVVRGSIWGVEVGVGWYDGDGWYGDAWAVWPGVGGKGVE